MSRVTVIARAGFLAIILGFLPGCNHGDFTEENFSTEPMRATIGYTSAIHDELVSLPPPEEQIVVAVYKFRDQTGQYKTSASATTFSTAVTQGATSMLSKALEDSGWFIPIEREGLPNLLNERKIIRSSRLQYQSESGQTMPELPPLLYAGVLLEGGIVSYDTNFITSGLGVKYFGVGGSGQLRKDRVTIYLRLVSVKNGQVLKTVSTTKSILSKEVDFGVYRFVSVQKLFEAETGFSTNEPPSMCVLEAIEKAVYTLIIEGIEKGIWSLKNPQDINSPIIQSYFEERKQVEKMIAFDKKGDLVEVKAFEEQGPEPVLSRLQNTIRETPMNGEMAPEPIRAPETKAIEQVDSETMIEVLEPEVIEALPPKARTSSDVGIRIIEQDKPKSVLTIVKETIGKSSSEPLNEGAPLTEGK